MINLIKDEAEARNITRLCHFTPSRNLSHILAGEKGVLATKHLLENERNIFTPTDLKRLDGHQGHICCSVEYPNVWYFDKARSQEILFRDWVVLFINPKYLWLPGTRFCSRNAASNYGNAIAEGEAAFTSMFAQSVMGTGGRTFNRSTNYLTCCPTDNQAEVLIPDQIEISDITGIVVPTETQAQNEIVRLDLQGISKDKYKFIVAPDLFDKYKLKDLISSGRRPHETIWNKGSNNE